MKKPKKEKPKSQTIIEYEACKRLMPMGEGLCRYCGGKMYLWKRPINRDICVSAIVLRRCHDLGHNYVNMEQMLLVNGSLAVAKNRDFHKMRYWGLAEPMPGHREDGSTHTGYWRSTERGRAFSRGEITLPRYAFVYHNNVLGYSTEQAHIREARIRNFNYQEILGNLF
jgi:hypothetical protein